jgi:hypothetical protein
VIAATLALNQFQQRYTPVMIANDRYLQSEETRLISAKTKAWNDRFAAESAAYPPSLESILCIVAKSGYTREVAPFLNLSKATIECENLQRYMRDVRNKWGVTQPCYVCFRGMTTSVMRMLEMRSIDVEAKRSNEVGGRTCFMIAASHGHLDTCRLLIDKGALIEEKDRHGLTPLHCAAQEGCIEIVRLLCDRGANIEARDNDGRTPLHLAAYYGHISVEKEIIEVRNAEINARTNNRRTSLSYGLNRDHSAVPTYLASHGGIF